jgi:hypothetical protein
MSSAIYVYKIFFKQGYSIETRLEDSPDELSDDFLALGGTKVADIVYNADPIIFKLSDVLYFEKIPT